jgi:hypothetical protein
VWPATPQRLSDAREAAERLSRLIGDRIDSSEVGGIDCGGSCLRVGGGCSEPAFIAANKKHAVPICNKTSSYCRADSTATTNNQHPLV